MTRNVAGPVVRGDDLWGREGEIRELKRLLTLGSVLVSAPRRYGKTSLVSALEREAPETAAVVHLDVEYVDSPAALLGEVAAALIQHDHLGAWFRKVKGLPSGLTRYLRSAIDEVGVGLGGIGEAKLKLRDSLDDPGAWRPLAEQLLEALAAYDRPIYVLLDEFPVMIGEWMARDTVGLGPSGVDVTADFLRWMHAIRQSRSNAHVRFLLYGSVNLEPLLARQGWEALIGDLQRFRLRPLTDENARNFVEAVLSSERVTFDPGVPETIVALCGGVHFFLQMTIAEVIRDAGGQRISTTRLERVFQEHVLGAANRYQFSHWISRIRGHYGDLADPATRLLSRLSKSPLRMDVVRSMLEGTDVDRLIAMLEGDYYTVVDRDVVRFENPLLQEWWKRHAPAGTR